MPQLNTTQAGLAAYEETASFTDEPLFTGERQQHTDKGTFAADQNLPAHTVLARDSDGNLVPAQYGGEGALGKPVAISMVAVKTEAAETKNAPCYWGGCFNPNRLYWHASYDTVEKKLAAFGEASLSNIAIKAMR